MSQDEVIRFLSDPRSYGSDVSAVERNETHGALVFLAGDRAYKLKRAVRFPYMDYSTPELRKSMCEAELEVNRRTAPELYLEVRAIARKPTGALAFSDAPDAAIDWVLVMCRFEQTCLLEEMRKRGTLDFPLMRSLADVIAALHAKAEIHRDYGGWADIEAVVSENESLLETMTDHPFEPDSTRSLNVLVRAQLDLQGDRLDRRRRDGFVRRCHGDLHLNNICLLQGRPVPFDAIEFNDTFACIDVMYDLAFLLMDLDRHGMRPHANAVLNQYLEGTLDYDGLAALPLFLSCRAAIRAHVTATRARQTVGAVAQQLDREAKEFLARALAYVSPTPARLVAIGGLSGTGKTTLARAIAPALGAAPGAIVLRSDMIRKKLLGAPEFERLPETAYDSSITERVYTTISESAARILAAGHSVIADAVFGDNREREGLSNVAQKAGVRLDGFWLQAPFDVLEQRIRQRHYDASDATPAVLRNQMAHVSVPDDWLVVPAGESEELCVRFCTERLDLPAGTGTR